MEEGIYQARDSEDKHQKLALSNNIIWYLSLDEFIFFLRDSLQLTT